MKNEIFFEPTAPHKEEVRSFLTSFLSDFDEKK